MKYSQKDFLFSELSTYNMEILIRLIQKQAFSGIRWNEGNLRLSEGYPL